jgi:hypothetical protein
MVPGPSHRASKVPKVALFTCDIPIAGSKDNAKPTPATIFFVFMLYKKYKILIIKKCKEALKNCLRKCKPANDSHYIFCNGKISGLE